MQEAPLCKFCLESNDTSKNPFIEPCDCRGSMKFVHEQCLTRWRRLNPARNADFCLLCMQPYRLAIGEILEHLPDETSFVVFFLRYPFLLCFTVNYLGAVQYTMHMRQSAYDILEIYQYIFQIVFFVLFYSIWTVKDKARYWKFWPSTQFYAIVALHVFSNYYIHEHNMYAIGPLNLALAYYYRKHRQILERLNTP